MKSPSALLVAGAAALTVTLSACDGLKEAMSAHIGTVARAGSQELSVDRLATLLNEAKIPPRKDVASAIANTWLDYQLLGQAAAKGDTTVSPATIDSAAWAQIAGLKARRYYEAVSKTWGSAPDPALGKQMYANGELLAAQHILILTRGVPDSLKPSLAKRAQALRAQVTSANFAELAAKNSQDPQSARQGGQLGLFKKGMMVPAFEQALLALKPGEISPVVETEFGYHIIRRPTYDEVKDGLAQASGARAKQQAESAFVANLQKAGKVEMRSDAASTARVVINDPDGHAKDGSTLATSTAGTFTAGRFAQWLQSVPAVTQQQQRASLQAAPDSVVSNFVRQFVINELVIKSADSAKMGPTPEEMTQLHQGFITSRNTTMAQLGIDPKSLADSAKTPSEREQLASARINAYMDRLVSGQAQYAEVAQPIARVLRDRSDGASINPAGIDRAVEKAVKTHASADSSRRASQPASAVPMGPPAGAVPQGAAPQPQQR